MRSPVSLEKGSRSRARVITNKAPPSSDASHALPPPNALAAPAPHVRLERYRAASASGKISECGAGQSRHTPPKVSKQRAKQARPQIAPISAERTRGENVRESDSRVIFLFFTFLFEFLFIYLPR